MALRIDIEPGGEYLLPFAKKKLEQLKRDTPTLVNKRIYASTGEEIFVQRGFVDLIRIRGVTDGARLFNWTETNLPVSTGPWGYRLSSAIDPSRPASQIITPVALPALGTALSLRIGGINQGALNRLPGAKARFIRVFERLVRTDSWLAYQLLGYAVQSGFLSCMRGGIDVAITADDSIVSRWNNGEFYLMLGAFSTNPTPAGSRLIDQTYTGVIVPWTALKANLGNVDGHFLTNLDAPNFAGLVRDVSGVTVKATGLVQNLGSVAIESNKRLARTSPYAVCFDYGITTSTGPTTDLTTTFNRTLSSLTLDTSGTVVRGNMLDGLVIGTTTVSNAPFAVTGGYGYSPSAMDADLTFYSGGGFVKYGKHHSFGTAGSPSIFGTAARDQDLPPGFVKFRGYIHQYNVVIAGTGSNGTVIAPVALTGTFPYHSTFNLNGAAQQFFNMTGLLDDDRVASFDHVVTSGSGSDTGFQSAIGMGGFDDWAGNHTGTFMPQDSGLPPSREHGPIFNPPVTIGGIYWPRDGGMGVLIYQFPPAQSAARQADVQKYQNIFFAVPGFRRIANADGTFTPEPSWEDPEVVIARIASNTNIIVNNFASPALLPWLDEGFCGVILDP